MADSLSPKNGLSMNRSIEFALKKRTVTVMPDVLLMSRFSVGRRSRNRNSTGTAWKSGSRRNRRSSSLSSFSPTIRD
jgi:hypothetical protein